MNNRKAFEAAVCKLWGYGPEALLPGVAANLERLWEIALSVAPAPVAAVWVDTAHLGELTVDRDGEGLPDGIETMLFREPPNEYPWTPLYTSPPVQEGPKGVEADAKFEKLLFNYRHLILSVPRDCNAIHTAYEALRQYFKQCTAQSIPAAPCQCKPGETTGWTDDDIMVPRCNVCGLVVMRVVAERKAERAAAAIDEEGREALKEAVANFREDMSDLHPQSSLLPIYRKHIAAIDRLLSGN